MHTRTDHTPQVCPICSTEVLTFVSIDERPLVICAYCRHIAWRVMPTEGELSAYYAAAYSRDHDQIAIQTSARDYYRQHAGDLARKVGTGTNLTLLDYGCAWPTMLEEAKSISAHSRLIGADYDQAALEHGAAIGLEMLSPDDLVQKLGEGSVDILRFSHVIEHMRDPLATLRELARLLKDGGLIYITQPIFPALMPEARPAGIKDAVYPEHLHFFTAASLNIAVSAMGADIFEIAAFQKEEDVAAIFEGGIDHPHAAEINKPLAHLTPGNFHRLGGYPTFIGENVYLYARKRGEADASKPAARRLAGPRSFKSRLSGIIKRISR